jgi:hypothetical protein
VWCTGLALLAAVAAGCGRPDAVEPTDEVGGMELASVPLGPGVFDLFTFCRAVVLEPGTYHRHCTVPWVSMLYLGYGEFAAPKELERVWPTLRWTGWLDGRRLDLEAFGSSDRTLAAYAPAGYKDVTLRTFDVTMFSPTPGAHTLRYLREPAGGGRLDVTWTFTIERR